MKSLTIRILALAMLLGMAFASPVLAAPGTITLALPADIVSLDPMGHNDIYTEKVSFLLFDRLFKLDTNFKAVPSLVEKWSQPSKTEWLLTIRKGVRFSDGAEMTSDDVKFSLERSKQSPNVKHVLANMTKADIVDKYTVKVTTDVPFAPFLFTLAHAGTSIVQKKYATGSDNWRTPVTSGSYTFSQWISGDKVVLKKNGKYWNKDGMGQTDTVVFKIVPEATSATIALETGEVDVLFSLASSDVKRVKANQKLVVLQKPSTDIQYLGMNVDKSPFDKAQVRQAFNYALDKDAILTVALDGLGTVASSVIPVSIMGHKDGPYTYNPEKARQMLNAAGYDFGQTLQLWASGDTRKKIAAVIQANLAAIGVKAEIQMFEWGAYLEATNSGNQQVFLLGWSSNPDPDSMMTPLFSKGSIGAQNRTRYISDKVEQLLSSGRVELNLERRVKIYNDMDQAIMQDAPWVPLYTGNNIVAANAKLKGVELSPQGLWDIEKIHY